MNYNEAVALLEGKSSVSGDQWPLIAWDAASREHVMSYQSPDGVHIATYPTLQFLQVLLSV